MATEAPTKTHVEISAGSFQRAMERYIDDNKPDPLMRQQIESWTLTWHPSTTLSSPSSSSSSSSSPELPTTADSSSFVPTHWVAGNAIWEGEYMTLRLSVLCYWKGTKKDGAIRFSCDVVRGEFTTEPKVNQDKSLPDMKAVKVAQKIHQKMIKRLRDDDYISKLVKGQKQNLVEATITVKDTGELEERVYCDETTAEGIRRGIFTTAESSLDVFDWIVCLPFLPSIAHEGCVSITTPLADRVKLRCLEEATYDACEQQDEEEIVDDLHISKKSKSK